MTHTIVPYKGHEFKIQKSGPLEDKIISYLEQRVSVDVPCLTKAEQKDLAYKLFQSMTTDEFYEHAYLVRGKKCQIQQNKSLDKPTKTQ